MDVGFLFPITGIIVPNLGILTECGRKFLLPPIGAYEPHFGVCGSVVRGQLQPVTMLQVGWGEAMPPLFRGMVPTCYIVTTSPLTGGATPYLRGGS